MIRLLVLPATLFVLTACAPTFKRTPVPRELAAHAHIPGLEHVRYAGDQAAPIFSADGRDVYLAQATASGLIHEPQRMLAISGGGARGAFGAGLLVGWTESGTRPSFSYVTGISTGALTAPFAFLGPDYDDELESVYTTLDTDDIINSRGLIGGISSDAFADTTPLRRMIDRYITPDMIDALGREHEKGRRLYVGTTNLDTMQQVYWSVSAIAASGRPDARSLVLKILLASASIPGAFPPVYFDVVADGERYDEMHVDGGVSSQVFVYPLTVDLAEVVEEHGINDDIELYVIRNARLDPEWESVQPKLLDIIGRSIGGLVRRQGFGDLYQIYLATLRDDIGFNLAVIPADFDTEPEELFDPVYMRELFDVGRAAARDGYSWLETPPGVDAADDEALEESMEDQR